MKKNLFYSIAALLIAGFGSCSQEEVLTDVASQDGKNVSLCVNVPTKSATRALPDADGHKLRCIMEIWNAEGTAKLDGYDRLVQDVTTDQVTFSFAEPENEYKCLFWADYIAQDASDNKVDNLYATTSLNNITLAKTDNAIFGTEAADAFCGVYDSGTMSGAITLNRPFAKVNFNFKASEIKLSDYNQLAATYNTPSGYNMTTGKATSTTQVTFTNTEFAPDAATWFSAYIFAPEAGSSKLESSITMTLTSNKADVEKKTLTIAAGQVPLNKNQIVNAGMNVNESTNITVDFNDQLVDPDAPQAMEVGDYLYKDGTYGTSYDEEQVIGIVYAVGKDVNDNSDYGEKTVAGYAMSVKGFTGNRALLLPKGYTQTVTYPAVSDVSTTTSGLKLTGELIPAFSIHESALLNNTESGWKLFLSENAISADNLSAWYIPTIAQMNKFVGLALGCSNIDNLTDVKKNETFAQSITTASADFLITATSWNFFTSCNTEGKVITMIITRDGNGVETITKYNTPAAANLNAAIRPVLTIFKK